MPVDKTLPGSYISTSDFINDATGINTNTLKPGVLARRIARASRWVDMICRQSLYATLITDTLMEDRSPIGYSIDLADSTLKAFPSHFPIRAVNSVSYYLWRPDAPTVIDPTLVTIQNRWFQIDGIWAPWRKNSPSLKLVSAYVAGYPVSTLSASAASGQPVIAVTASPQAGVVGVEPQAYGFLPGQQLEIQDDSLTELVTVASTSGNNVTLTANLANTHAADVMVVDPAFSAAQQATSLLTSALIKTRGVGPITLKNERVEGNTKGAIEPDLVSMARELLEDFIFHV